MSEQVINAQTGVNLNDSVFQTTLSNWVEMGVPNVDKGLAIFKFMGSVGSLTEMGNMVNGERLRFAISEVDFPMQTGHQVIHHRKPQDREVIWDDPVFAKDNIRATERVSFSYGPRQVTTAEGYTIGDEFFESLLPVNRLPDIINGLSRDYASTLGEFCMARFSGRLGDTSRGWQTFKGNETSHDTSSAMALGENGARQSHPKFASLNVDGIFDKPSDYLSPANADLENNSHNPTPHLMTSAHKLTYTFLTKVLQWATIRESERFRGLGFMPAETMKMEMNKEGTYTKIPAGITKGCLLISHEVATTIRQDSEWIESQRNMATNMGAHQGWSTGDIGSISGFCLWQSHKIIRFKAGASGTVNAHRCLMLGRGAGMIIRYKPQQIPPQWDGIVRERNYLPKDVPTMAPSMRIYVQKQMGIRAIFWQSWINARIVTWPMEYAENYKEVNNVVAVDVAV